MSEHLIIVFINLRPLNTSTMDIPGMMVAPTMIKISCPWVSSPAIPLGGLVSPQLGLIPSVKQISNALGEPRMETKLVPGHPRTPWPPHPLPPKGVHFMRGTCIEQHEWASRSPGQASRPPSVRPRVSIRKTSKGPSHVGEWDKGKLKQAAFYKNLCHQYHLCPPGFYLPLLSTF